MSGTNQIHGQKPSTFTRFKSAAKSGLKAGAKAAVKSGAAFYNLTTEAQNKRAGKAIIDFAHKQMNDKDTQAAFNANPAAAAGALAFGAGISGIAEGVDAAADAAKNANTIATNIPLFEAAKAFYNTFTKGQ